MASTSPSDTGAEGSATAYVTAFTIAPCCGGSPAAGYPNTPGSAEATSTDIGIDSALSRSSRICWLVLVLIPAETSALICPFDPKKSGRELPAMITVASARVVPKGTEFADAVPFPRFWPNSETMDPGESGACAAKVAPFTAALSTGAIDEAPNPPVTARVPVRLLVGSLAVIVTVTGPVLPDRQVFCHVPPCTRSKLSRGSPLENDAVTLPVFSALPQSSLTCASIATGHAAGTPNDWPSVVIAGTSCVGVQPALSRGLSRGFS